MRRHAIVISILLICHVCTTQEIAPQYVTIDDSENWEPYDGRDFHPILASHHDVEQPSEDTVGIDKQTNDLMPAGQSSSPIPQSQYDSPEPLPSEDTVVVDKQTNDGIPAGQSSSPIPQSPDDSPEPMPSEDTVGIDKQTNDGIPAGQSSSPIPQSPDDSPEPMPSEDTVGIDKQTNDGIPAGQSIDLIPQSPDDSPEPLPSEDTVGIDKQTNDGIPAGQSSSPIPQSPDDSPEPLPSEDTVAVDKQTNDGIPAGQSSDPIPQSQDDSPEPLPSEDTVAVDKQTNDGIPAGQSSDPIPQSQDVSPKPSPTEETVLRGRPIYPPEGRPIPRSQDNSPKPSPPEDTVVGDKQVDDVKEDDEAMKNLETIKFESNSEPSDPYEFETDQESYFQVLLTPYIMYSLLTLACIVAAVTYQFFLKNDSTPIKQSIGAVNEASNHTGPPLRVIQSSKERDIARLERTNKLLGMKRRLAPLETRIKEFQLDDPYSRLTESKLRIKTMKPYEILLEEKQELSTKVKMNRYERLLQIRNLKDIKKIPGILRYIDYQKQRESRELNICTMLAEDEFLREQMELFRELRANFQQEYSNLKSEIDNVRVRGRDIERERLNFLSGEIETRN